MHAIRRGKPFLVPSYMLSASASDDDATTVLIFWQRTSTSLFYFLLSFYPKWYMAAARLHAWLRTSKSASETILRIISLA